MFVNYDLGADTNVPTISTAVMNLISILIAMFLPGLLALAVYASATPSWADSLDAWAMIRIGAAVGSERLPLLVGKNTDAIGGMDELPGWLGDADEMAVTGRIELGALGSVRSRRRYLCNEADEDGRCSSSNGREIALELRR